MAAIAVLRRSPARVATSSGPPSPISRSSQRGARPDPAFSQAVSPGARGEGAGASYRSPKPSSPGPSPYASPLRLYASPVRPFPRAELSPYGSSPYGSFPYGPSYRSATRSSSSRSRSLPPYARSSSAVPYGSSYRSRLSPEGPSRSPSQA